MILIQPTMIRFIFFIFLGLYSFLSISQDQTFKKGIESFKQEKYVQASKELRRAYEKMSKEDENYVVCLEYLGLSYYYQERYDSTVVFLGEEYPLISDFFVKKDVAILLGTSYFLLQKYALAIPYFTFAFDETKVLAEHELQLYNCWALCYYYQNDFELSREKSKWLLKSLKKNKQDESLFYYQVINNIGLAYYDESNYKEAEKYYLEVLDFHQKNTNYSTDFAIAVNNISMLYSAIGKYDLAKKRLLEVKEFYYKEDGGNHENYALILLNLASIELNNGINDTQVIEKELLQALNIIKNNKQTNTLLYGQIIYHLGWFYRDINDHTQTEEYFLETQRFFYNQNLTSHEYYISSLINLGILYSDLGYTEQAIKFLDVVIEYAKNIDYQDETYIEAFNAKGMLCYQQGQNKEAIHWFQKGLDLCEKRGLSGAYYLYPLLVNNLGLAHSEINELALAEKYFLKTINLYQKQEKYDPLSYGTTLSNLGTIYLGREDYTQAEAIFRDALVKFEKANNFKENRNYYLLLNNMALVQLYIGAYPKAIDLFSQVLTFYEANQLKNFEYALLNNNLGLAYFEQVNDSFYKAEEYFSKAHQLFHELEQTENRNYVLIINNLAHIHQSKGNNFKAKMMFYEAKKIKEKQYKNYEEDLEYILILNNIGLTHYSLKEYKAAKDTYQKAILLIKKHFSKNINLYSIIHSNLALLYDEIGEEENASMALKEVVSNKHDAIEKNFPTLNDKEREQFIKKTNPFFSQFRTFYIKKIGLLGENDYQINNKDIGELYNLQLQTKGILLNNYQRFKNKIIDSNDSILVKKYVDFLAKKEQIAKYTTFSKKELLKEDIDMNQLLVDVNKLEKELVYQSKDFESMYQQTKIDWKNIQQKIDENEIAIEMLKLLDENNQSVYVALIIAKKMDTPFAIRMPSALDTKRYAFYRNTINYELEDTLSYQYYWKPIDDLLKKYVPNATKIYFSAEGIYNNINLNTLYNPKTKQYLLAQKEIILVTKTKDILTQRKIASHKKAYLFGNPKFLKDATKSSSQKNTKRSYLEGMHFDQLPGTKKEVEQIEKILLAKQWFVKSYLGELAEENSVKNIKNPYLLHFSTHGYFIDDSSFSTTDMMLNSGIVLAGIENYFIDQDGLLTAYEVMNMELDSTELVVLSACETGLGKITNGEGVYGLQRAFKVAGAHQIIMSLWKVDDEATQLLMRYFYEEWLSDKKYSVHLALKKAQEKIAKNPLYKHPYYWGAFQIIE